MENRQIKFRAWHKGQKEMFYPNCSKNVKGYLGLNKKQIFEKFNDDELMQFTGLKDKNGVDIYEGDIIRYITNYYGKLKEDNIQEIKWIDDMEHDGFGCPLATGFLLIGYDWQVIGNIYENPNLLQDGK